MAKPEPRVTITQPRRMAMEWSEIMDHSKLKTPLKNFLDGYASVLGRNLYVWTEHRQNADDRVSGVRLDMVVENGYHQLIGHVELKAPDKSGNPYQQTNWIPHDKSQWKRLQNHPNLIYSNGREWTLVREGYDKPIVHVVLERDQSGELSPELMEKFQSLVDQYLNWSPIIPSTPKALASLLAPLARYLRDSVTEIVTDDNDDFIDELYANWRQTLLPGASAKDFADSFAQTFTYALLLARVESDVDPKHFTAKVVSEDLRHNGHKLIGSVLEVITQNRFRSLVEQPIKVLETTIGYVDVERFTKKGDPWLYFYEDFLAAYDPKMRKDSGVFYTPMEIVETQVRLIDHILQTRFGLPEGLGDQNIAILDNATGSGAYPLAVARHVLDKAASKPDAARSLAKRLYGFELLMGPYSVAHMRLTQMLESTGIDLGNDGVQIFLTNSLTDEGDTGADNQRLITWDVEIDISEESRRAGMVKNDATKIRVILGNPPYDRGSKAKATTGDKTGRKNIVLEGVLGRKPLLDDFIEPLTARGAGGQAKNLYNSYIYFFRWAIWKACEQVKDQAGIVSYITSSSYLRGPGFAGMREYMRKVFDEIWIIDLGGEGRGARKEENVFNIQTPVAIFFGIQHPKTRTGSPKRHSDRLEQKAKVFYTRIHGSSLEKLNSLNEIEPPEISISWEAITVQDLGGNLVPDTSEMLGRGVALDSIFPWVTSGAQFKRKWPISSTESALEQRWAELFSGGVADVKFKSDRDRTVETAGKTNAVTGEPLPALSEPDSEATATIPVRYGYRSFDRQYCFPDHRVGTYLRQSLWDTLSDFQIYIATLTSNPLSKGPAVTISPYVPDLDYFRGSFGAKNIFPLYRNRSADQMNISGGLLDALERYYGRRPEALEVASYAVGLLGTGAYTERFQEELTESTAHVHFTKDSDLFTEVAEFGRQIIFEQTWGERGGTLNEFGQQVGQRYRGKAQLESPPTPTAYPESWSYDADSQKLFVGDGVFADVSPEVAAFEVSGMNVLGSWLGYRMKTPKGKSSSPLDRIQAPTWEHDTELLELLWQLEFMIAAEPKGAELLERVLQSELITPEEIGEPTAAERKEPPKRPKQATLDS